MRADLAKAHGLPKEWFLIGDGSSEILKLAANAFTGPGLRLVAADPTFEAIAVHARVQGTEVVAVPLDRQFAHDPEKMAAERAGLFYVCNPNNPTGSITAKSRVRSFLDKVPKDGNVLVDEAYHHYADSPDYESVVPLVATHANLLVTRTFSKIYGMAGLRAGAAIGRPDLLKKITPYSGGAMPVTGMTAATASLKSKKLVPERRKLIAGVREDVLSFLDKHNFKYVPSVSNKFMVDVQRPGQEIKNALEKEKVYVGRIWQTWPTHP